VCLIGAMVCVVTAALRSRTIGSCQWTVLPLPAIVQRGWSRHGSVSSAIEESDLYPYLYLYTGKNCNGKLCNNGWTLTLVQYTDGKLLPSAINRCSSWGDRHYICCTCMVPLVGIPYCHGEGPHWVGFLKSQALRLPSKRFLKMYVLLSLWNAWNINYSTVFCPTTIMFCIRKGYWLKRTLATTRGNDLAPLLFPRRRQ